MVGSPRTLGDTPFLSAYSCSSFIDGADDVCAVKPEVDEIARMTSINKLLAIDRNSVLPIKLNF